MNENGLDSFSAMYRIFASSGGSESLSSLPSFIKVIRSLFHRVS